MPWQRIRERLHRDGWLILALAAATLLCFLLSNLENPASSQTSQEARLSRVLSSMAGAGQVEVAVFYQEESTLPCGAVVVAQGADDAGIRVQLTRAVCTLLGLTPSQVDVFKLGGMNP